MKKLFLLLISFYQKFISQIMPGKCRFIPTCSVYFTQALNKYGFYKGTFLGIKRILKCHPFHQGGYDPLE